MKAYEVEVHFIGEPDFYYFETRKEAEKAAEEINNLPAEAASFGSVRARATINEIDLKANQAIEGGEITTHTRIEGR